MRSRSQSRAQRNPPQTHQGPVATPRGRILPPQPRQSPKDDGHLRQGESHQRSHHHDEVQDVPEVSEVGAVLQDQALVDHLGGEKSRQEINLAIVRPAKVGDTSRSIAFQGSLEAGISGAELFYLLLLRTGL